MPPFRLLDRVVCVDLERGQLEALRHLTAGDAVWPAEADLVRAHQPAVAAFPEVLMIEALCQAAACLNSLELAQSQAAGTHLGYLVAISDFRFPRDLGSQGLPEVRACIGDTLLLKVERQGSLGALSAFAASASVLRPSLAAVSTATTEPNAYPDTHSDAYQVACGRLLFAISPK